MVEQHYEDYRIQELALTAQDLAPLVALHHEVLPSRLYATDEKRKAFLDEILGALNGREHLILGAYIGGVPVAYKLGYRTGNRRECFYSWLGGVHPNHRRKGLARVLTRIQHTWAAERGFTYMETHTWGDNPGMMILNLQEGFVAAGALSAVDRPGARIIMRKLLRRNE
ncbi:MAG: GNAT family N-acetyltransferase [Planctomycetes bacterium]|nr:GNAT family N-acetyltransferase [Planctomycetota bacterium]